MVEGYPRPNQEHSSSQADQTAQQPRVTLDKQAFLSADDIPGNVWDLGFIPGERPWWKDTWDNFILKLRKADIVRIRRQADAFWTSHFTTEKTANRWRLSPRKVVLDRLSVPSPVTPRQE